jgi:hypothetical protein
LSRRLLPGRYGREYDNGPDPGHDDPHMGVRGAAAGREAAVPRGVRPYLTERRQKAAAADREVLVCGDSNMAAAEADI